MMVKDYCLFQHEVVGVIWVWVWGLKFSQKIYPHKSGEEKIFECDIVE
jgi:hypothetical protein